MKRLVILLLRIKKWVYELFRAYLPRPIKVFLRTTILKTWPTPFALSEITAVSLPPISECPEVYDVIIFPIIDWEFRFQRPQQIAARFANAGHRVFYLRSAFSRRRNPGYRLIRESIYEVDLPGPSATNIYTDRIEERMMKSIHHGFDVLRQNFKIREAVCIVDLPFWTPAAFALRERFGWKIIYDCMDHHSGFNNVSEDMLKSEEELTRLSDLVITTSHSLFQKQSVLNSNCMLVPNAVDFDHFHSPVSEVPAELQDVQKPVIGYYGAISEWFDVDLIHDLALSRPLWNFILIGHTFGSNLDALRNLKNVHLTEEKPYSTLPGYLHAFDVCIIPFKKTPLTDATNPVKMFEFLSAGKPVVASDLTELRNYSDMIQLASGMEDWLNAIEKSLRENSPELMKARIDFAAKNSWENRFQQIHAGIRNLYPKVSIIIVTYNNLDYTRLCLSSIYQKTIHPNFELIIIDNASTDGTPEFLTEFQSSHQNVRVILNPSNEGFARANNQGIAVASGQYIVFLNNDTVVTNGWLSRLIYHLKDPDIGMIGPVTSWSGNESRIPVDYQNISQMDQFAQRYTFNHEGKTFPIRMLALFCVVMPRSVVERVGLLDERFGIGMFEDDDYAQRVKQAGYKIICAEDVFIHHWGRASFSKMEEKEYYRLFDENRAKFEEKWQAKWQPHQFRQQ